MGASHAQDTDDVLRSDLSAVDALAARKNGEIASLLDVRMAVRERYDVVQFYNARLLANEDGKPILYCVPVEIWGGTLMTIHVDAATGEILPDQEARAADPDNPCSVETDQSYARPDR